jgi:DNA invertase Pin-like site-specific DNA recombinase
MHYYRLRAGAPIAGGERADGEKHGNAKLTAENVRELRSLYSDGATLRQLADKFGVSNVSIYNAVSGKTWRSLDAG